MARRGRKRPEYTPRPGRHARASARTRHLDPHPYPTPARSEGGTSIEDLAESHPEKIIKVPIDIGAGITDAQAAEVVKGLECSGDKTKAAEQIKALYKLFSERDCTMVEVNTLAEDAEGNLIAADAKIGFDDNAFFRQNEVFDMSDESQEDPREVAAAKWDLNYVGLDGNIGCMVNGAGLAMATMDIIAAYGGTPANFLDVGGSAKVRDGGGRRGVGVVAAGDRGGGVPR